MFRVHTAEVVVVGVPPPLLLGLVLLLPKSRVINDMFNCYKFFLRT